MLSSGIPVQAGTTGVGKVGRRYTPLGIPVIILSSSTTTAQFNIRGGPATPDEKLSRGRRVAASDDLEVSAYLEIAKSLEGVGSEATDGLQNVNQGIVIIDFGSQYSHLIARRVRELKVYSEIVSASSTWESVQHINPRGVILSGGPASVYEPDAPSIPEWVFERALPVLGICYGMQALVHQLGGKVVQGHKQEFGGGGLAPGNNRDLHIPRNAVIIPGLDESRRPGGAASPRFFRSRVY